MRYLLIILIAALARRGAATTAEVQGNVTIYMAGSGGGPGGRDRKTSLTHKQAHHFLSTIFQNHDSVIMDRRQWPTIKTDNCPGIKPAQDRNPPHQRGCALAHRQAWEEFYWRHRDLGLKNLSIRAQPKVVMFEDDVMEIDPRAPDVAFQSVLDMTTHLLYLGYCMDKEPGVKPPLCAHAYALSLEGARILLTPGVFDWCLRTNGQIHGNVDDQLSQLGARHETTGLTWQVAGRAVGRGVPPLPQFGFNDSWIRKKALTDGFTFGRIWAWEGSEGGLFYQIKYEELAHLTLKDGGLYQIKWPSTIIYLFKNGTFRAFPNIKTFAAMGFDLQDSKNPVHVVPRSQVLSLIGPELPSLA
jgi:hypothetical protein